MPELTDADHAILRFEEGHPQRGARAGDRIRAELGLPPAVYYQRLHHLLECPEAVAIYPRATSRAMRLRDQAAARRARRSTSRRAA